MGRLSYRRPSGPPAIGDLDQRVRIERLAPDPGRKDGGKEVETWQAVATVWAEVRAVGGAEMMRNGQVQANASYRVRVRHRDDVGPSMRLVWLTNRNKLLSITAAPPAVGRANQLELVCVEEV